MATANGVDAVNVAAHIVDTAGAPIGGCSVTLAVSGIGNTVSPASATDSGGDSSATLASRVAETKTVSATVACGSSAPASLASTPTVEFVAGPGSQLVFLVQPQSADAGVVLVPGIEVAIEDASGNIVTGATGAIDLALAPNAHNAVVEGTTQVALTGGTATFSDLNVRAPGQQYQLVASSSLATSMVASYPFDIGYGEPSSMSTLVVTPASGPADGVTPLDAVVTIVNDGGVGIPGLPVAVAMAGAGADVYPRAGVTDANGQFVGKLTSTVAASKTVTATSGTLTLNATATFATPPCTPLLPGLPALPQGSEVRGLVTSDFDGDGHPDLAVLHPGDVAILRGVGDGRLHQPYTFATPGSSVALAGGDLNGDGRVDLVTANATSIVAFLDESDGQLTNLGALALPAAPKDIALADLDGNGTLDLVARTEQTIVLALGMGDGTFTTPVTYPLGFTVSISSATVVTADVNGDGRTDVVSYGSNGAFSTLLSRGDGTLQGPITTQLPITSFANGMAAADFDGDGAIDLVVPQESGGLLLMHGNGDGTFTYVRQLEFFGSLNVTTYDFNGDGHPDVLASAGGNVELRMYINNGDGTFQSPQVYSTVASAVDFAFADFDGDGRVDVGVAEGAIGSTGFVTIVPRAANGGFVAAPYTGDVPGPTRQWFVGTVGDFNGDGRLDLLAEDTVNRTWAAQLATAGGTYTRAADLSVSGEPYEARDFDRDGKIDAMFGYGANAYWARGNGDGSFQAPIMTSLGGADSLIANDFNGDGILDIAGVSFQPAAVHVALGRGDGTFNTAQAFAVANDAAESVLAADFNGDGKLDLATTSRAIVSGQTVGRFSVLAGHGDGTFQAAQTYPLTTTAGMATAGDFDGDGKIDLAVSREDAAIGLFKGRGDMTFDPETVISIAPLGSIWLRAADLDGDGILDLVGLGRSAIVLRGVGDGTFRPPLVYPGATFWDGAIADFDGNGRLDLLVGSQALQDQVVGFAMLQNLGCK